MLSDLTQIHAWTIAAYRDAEESRLARAAREPAAEPAAPENREPITPRPEPATSGSWTGS